MENTTYKKGDYFGPEKYKIVDVFTGGFSEVYKAKLGKKFVAFKTLKKEHKKLLTDIFYQDLLIEGSNWIEFGKHPNIVKCNFVGMYNGIPYIELEWIIGKYHNSSLRSYMYHERIEYGQALSMSIGILRGLIHAHNIFPNMIHRDIKPENILVNTKGVPKVTDFGIAQVFNKFIKRKDTNVFGTPNYMSPEIWKNDAVSIKSDIYALGCVLYELFYHNVLIEGKSIAEIKKKHQNPKNIMWDDDKKQINSIISKCLEINPSSRFDSYQEIEQSISQIKNRGKRLQSKPPQLSTSTYWELMKIGLSHKTAKYYQGAIEYYLKAYDIANEEEKAHNLSSMGNLLMELGHYDEAIKCFEKALKHKTTAFTEGAIKFNLGAVYANLREFDKALKYISEATTIQDDNDNFLLARGRIYSEMCRFDEAITDLDNCVKLKPSNFDAYRALGYAYHDLGDLEEAIRIYKFSANEFRTHSIILFDLILWLIREQDTYSALFYFERYKATESAWKSVILNSNNKASTDELLNWLEMESEKANITQKSINFLLKEPLDNILILFKVCPFIIDDAFISFFQEITENSIEDIFLKQKTRMVIKELKHLSKIINSARIFLRARSESDLIIKFKRHIKEIDEKHLLEIENNVEVENVEQKSKIMDSVNLLRNYLKQYSKDYS